MREGKFPFLSVFGANPQQIPFELHREARALEDYAYEFELWLRDHSQTKKMSPRWTRTDGNRPDFQSEDEWKSAHADDPSAIFHPEDDRHQPTFRYWNFKQFLAHHKVKDCETKLKGDYPFEEGGIGAENTAAPKVSFLA